MDGPGYCTLSHNCRVEVCVAAGLPEDACPVTRAVRWFLLFHIAQLLLSDTIGSST